MNETNRTLIVLFMGIVIMLAAIVIFLTWSANTDVIDALFDAVEYMEDHNDDAGRLIVTLGALIIAVLALLVIILELAPEDEEKELKVQQAGATTIVPAQALRMRLEEALLALPEVTSARARVSTKDDGIATTLEVTVTPDANVARVTQESTRVVVDAIQEDLGLPVKGVPVVRVSFGGAKPEPVASSASSEPQQSPAEQEPSPYAPPPGREEPKEEAANDWLPRPPSAGSESSTSSDAPPDDRAGGPDDRPQP